MPKEAHIPENCLCHLKRISLRPKRGSCTATLDNILAHHAPPMCLLCLDAQIFICQLSLQTVMDTDMFAWWWCKAPLCMMVWFDQCHGNVSHDQHSWCISHHHGSAIVSLDGSWSCPEPALGSQIDRMCQCCGRQTTFGEAFSLTVFAQWDHGSKGSSVYPYS